MKRFKKILLVLSGNDRAAIARAATVAKMNSARLTAVQVIDDSAGASLPPLTGLESKEPVRPVSDAAREEAEKAIAPHLKKRGVKAECKVLQGTAFVEVIREVLEREHDLVISSANHNGGLAERLFGSTNMQLMRKCPCPVWVVKPTRKRRYTRVLAAVDPSRTEPEERSLNRKILELGNSLAAHDKGEFHVVHAWMLFGESLLRAGGHPQRADVEGELRTLRAKHLSQLEELLEEARAKTEPDRVHLIKGNPEEVIPDLVAKTKTDVLVMGTVSRKGISRLLIGNTAEKILGQVDCSVLTVKPDGFVSPVSLPSDE